MLHRDHPTSVAFFDEAGAIASDRIFMVGLLRLNHHSQFFKEVKSLRKKHKYWDEFKWASITKANKPAYVDLIDLILDSTALFSCFVADRHLADPVARFGGTFQAYEKLTTQLLIGSVRPYELITVIADNYSAPNDRSFERTVREECNRRLRRLAVVSVVQIDSRSTEGLQLVDVITGAVGFGFKAMIGSASFKSNKAQVAQHLLTRCGVENFDGGYQGGDFVVKIYEHESWLRQHQSTLADQSALRTRRSRRGGRKRQRGSDRGSVDT